MAITINALTTGTGGLETTADASGSFSFQSDGSTIATVTSSGFSVTGTFDAGGLSVGGSNVVVDSDIGSTVQAYDADLTALAGLSSADGNFIVGSATGWVAESGATARTSLGLGTAATTASTDYATAAQGTTADSALQPGDIGSTVQAYDADLTTLGGLSSADGNFIVGSATGWVVESGATARTSLGLGTAATTASTDYATAAQGTTADSALQPGDIGSTVQAYDADTAKLDVAQTWTATQTYGDNVKQQFGAGNDLQIFHNGTASYVSDTGTGNLILQGTNVQLRNAGDTANYLVGVDGGATSIQYNGSTKLATSNTGVTVTGTVAATSYTGDGSALTGISVTPTAVSDQNNTSTGYFDLPVGTTAQRPASPAVGMIRYNTTESQYEIYKTSGWAYLSSTYFPYTIEYLIVAGGAGGGGGQLNDKGGGGGGAGGMLTGSLSVTPANNYTVTVGGGGAGGGTASDGSNGGNSSLTGVTTAIGGGGGARGSGGGPFNGLNGGSGGGATAFGSPGGTPGSGTAGQGNAGGSNPSANNSSGGGGKGSVGGNNSASAGGNGGSGSTWSDGNTYAGGGGGGAYVGSGGTGGSGGGGDGKGQPNPGAGNAGTSTTGGGGGGCGGRVANSGGNGGSGVVKIRYAGSQRGSGGTVTSSGGYTYHTFTGSGTFTA